MACPILLLICIGVVSGSRISFHFDQEGEGDFSIFIGNSSKEWFRSSVLKLHKEVWWSTDTPEYLVKLSDSYTTEGKDEIGDYYKYV